MGQYTKKGLLNGYKKNNTERAELDYYATPAVEVENILNELGYDFTGMTILEPCVGGGHMCDGIDAYLKKNHIIPKDKQGADYKDRGYKGPWNLVYGLDYLDDEWPISEADVIIMNPPYSTIEPFLIRSLEIAKKYLIVLCRTQALEGASRYEKIFSENPPTYIYQYIERIQCWRNGKKPSGSSAQAYCWLVWDMEKAGQNSELHWLHRSENY